LGFFVGLNSYIRFSLKYLIMKLKITLFSLLVSSLASAQITTFSSAIPYQGYDETQGYVGQGEYEIFLDNTNGVLDKPIILLDGFDPNDGRDIPSIYNLLNYGTGQNLADDLRNLGYDVIILNFPNYIRPATSEIISGGGDYIQRNAMLLVELLSQINAQKVGTEKNVVIGPSMGGLIARYGLRYMELNALEHDTRLYISFDAPHLGANIPIGFQHLFNYMAAGPLEDATVQILVNAMLKSNASREMLIDQFEGHLEAGSDFEFDPSIVLPTGKPGFRDAFQTELNTMGFPQQCRNIAIANGAGNGSMNGTPGMTVMDHTFYTSATQRAIINLHFTPLANQQIEVSRFRGQVSLFNFWITGYESAAQSKATAVSDGLDAAPGGKFDITSLADLAGSNALLTEFFDNLLIDYFDFIPTNSALAINTPNWYTPVSDVSITPFAATHVPSANENHVTLTPDNMAFALNEILNPPLAVQSGESFSGLTVRNPFGNSIEIYSEKPIAGAAISVVDLTGKQLYFESNQTISGKYSIPIALSNGIYLLTVKNQQGSWNRKLIKQ
jgi:pimeloyl-ACP methyl ester carboxylesterase